MSSTQTDKVEPSNTAEVLDVLVVGARFAGLYQLDRLRKLGFSVPVLWSSFITRC